MRPAPERAKWSLGRASKVAGRIALYAFLPPWYYTVAPGGGPERLWEFLGVLCVRSRVAGGLAVLLGLMGLFGAGRQCRLDALLGILLGGVLAFPLEFLWLLLIVFYGS